MKLVQLLNLTHPIPNPLKAKYCESFWTKFAGYMFHRPIPDGEAIILADNHESIMDTSIHMFFMRFDLAVIWLDRDLQVVDKTIAKKWRPYYASKSKAQFVIEAHVNRINDFQLKDQVKFEI